MKRAKYLFSSILIVTMLFSAGCGRTVSATENPDTYKKTEAGMIELRPGSYDSADTCVLMEVDEEAKTATFYNLDIERNYTLSYDSMTYFYDKYKTALTPGLLEPGSIVDITFLKSSKRLNTLMYSPDAWEYTEINRVSIDEDRRVIDVGNDTYKYDDSLKLLEDTDEITFMDINPVDILTIRGIGKTAATVKVEKGHGYLRLTGEERMVGGYIECGKVIKQIAEDMLLTVPEGTYDVYLTNKGAELTQTVTVERNKEVTIDLSEYKPESLEKVATVIFTVTPSDAKVFIDGKETDVSKPVTLEYGIHQVLAKAEGYVTTTSYIRIAEDSAGISIKLDPDTEVNKKGTVSGSDYNKTVSGSDKITPTPTPTGTVSGSDVTPTPTVTPTVTPTPTVTATPTPTGTVSGSDKGTTTPTYVPGASTYPRIIIDSPIGVEVYVDGYYVGLSPLGFKKTEGEHVITLSKRGYENKSYTIKADSDDKDVSYSFSELIESSNN